MDDLEREHEFQDARERRTLQYIEDNARQRQANEAVEATAKLTANSIFIVSIGGVTALLTFIAQKGISTEIKYTLFCFAVSVIATLLLTGVMYLQRFCAASKLDRQINTPDYYKGWCEKADKYLRHLIVLLWLVAFGFIVAGGVIFSQSAALASQKITIMMC